MDESRAVSTGGQLRFTGYSAIRNGEAESCEDRAAAVELVPNGHGRTSGAPSKRKRRPKPPLHDNASKPQALRFTAASRPRSVWIS
jgi:hypothetical protein